MNKSLRSFALALAFAVLVTMYGLVAVGCGSSGTQPGPGSTPNGGY